LPLHDALVGERRQVFDVPVAAFDVVEHRTLSVRCQFEQLHTSAFPASVTEPVQYGPNVGALAVHLTQGQMLPYARAAELIRDVYGLVISPGTLVAWVGEARTALQGTADLIAQYLRDAALVNADESGLRVAGKLHCLYIAANDTLTWYRVHAKRGMEEITAHGILPNRLGVLVHDCWAPYWKLDGATHALCNAHLLRELLYVKRSGKQICLKRDGKFVCTMVMEYFLSKFPLNSYAAVALQANLATLQGRLNQIEIDLVAARNDALCEREAAEAARIDLAKALLRLEADLGALRVNLDKERQGRVVADQQAAVMEAKLEGANERSGKAEAATIDAAAQARKHGEAVFAEAAKVEAAKNTISNLTGKLEAMQAQIERQAEELDATRQTAAELRGKPATKPPKAPSKE